jgi:hypothetical protein
MEWVLKVLALLHGGEVADMAAGLVASAAVDAHVIDAGGKVAGFLARDAMTALATDGGTEVDLMSPNFGGNRNLYYRPGWMESTQQRAADKAAAREAATAEVPVPDDVAA